MPACAAVWLCAAEFWPRRVVSLGGKGACSIVCGRAHTLVQTQGGACYVMGSNLYGELGIGRGESRSRRQCHVPVRIEWLRGGKPTTHGLLLPMHDLQQRRRERRQASRRPTTRRRGRAGGSSSP